MAPRSIQLFVQKALHLTLDWLEKSSALLRDMERFLLGEPVSGDPKEIEETVHELLKYIESDSSLSDLDEIREYVVPALTDGFKKEILEGLGLRMKDLYIAEPEKETSIEVAQVLQKQVQPEQAQPEQAQPSIEEKLEDDCPCPDTRKILLCSGGTKEGCGGFIKEKNSCKTCIGRHGTNPGWRRQRSVRDILLTGW